MDEEVKTVLDYCETLIREYYRPCDLETCLITRIAELVHEWKKRKEIIEKQGREYTGAGLQLIFTDVLRAVDLAKHNSEKNNKPICLYLRNGLVRPYTQVGGLGKYFLSHLADVEKK